MSRFATIFRLKRKLNKKIAKKRIKNASKIKKAIDKMKIFMYNS